MARLAEQRFVAGALLGQVTLQAAQTQVQGLGDALGGGLAIGQLRLQAAAHSFAATGRLQLLQIAPQYRLVVLGQFRVAVIQALLECRTGKTQQALVGIELQRRTKHRLPGRQVRRPRALQLHQQG